MKVYAVNKKHHIVWMWGQATPVGIKPFFLVLAVLIILCKETITGTFLFVCFRLCVRITFDIIWVLLSGNLTQDLH